MHCPNRLGPRTAIMKEVERVVPTQDSPFINLLDVS